MENEKFEDCPFCGHDAEIKRMGTNRVSMIISCTECGCSLESGETFLGKNCAWNTRAPRQELRPLDHTEIIQQLARVYTNPKHEKKEIDYELIGDMADSICARFGYH